MRALLVFLDVGCLWKHQIARVLGPFSNVVVIMLFVFFKIRVGEKVCGNVCNVV